MSCITDHRMHIRLNDLLFYAYIGVFEQEQTVGAQFQVDLDAELPVTEGMLKDELEGTVSYVDLFEIVHEEISMPCALLENAACRILNRIRDAHRMITHASVTITKLSPPIAKMNGSASVTLAY